MRHDEDVDLESIAKESHCFVGADLAQLTTKFVILFFFGCFSRIYRQYKTFFVY
jgi:SpoVK/Ycf46/Vps4 family AAA+-type ATPase